MRREDKIVAALSAFSIVCAIVIGCISYYNSTTIAEQNIANHAPAHIFFSKLAPEPTTEYHEVILTEEAGEQEPTLIDLGTFTVTAYCSCQECCGIWAIDRKDNIVVGATGRELLANYSIAVDPTVIPYGSEVMIGNCIYRADDCGGAIKGNKIDIYFSKHSDAVAFGKQTMQVYLKGGE